MKWFRSSGKTEDYKKEYSPEITNSKNLNKRKIQQKIKNP